MNPNALPITETVPATVEAPASGHQAPRPSARKHRWLDHALQGDWADHRECHIGGDFLLIYRLDGKDANEQIIFVRAGTHAELFE